MITDSLVTILVMYKSTNGKSFFWSHIQGYLSSAAYISTS